MRNTYDIAFNQDGELFGFDSDMEIGFGDALYRPIRLLSFYGGSEFGCRRGTGKISGRISRYLPGISQVRTRFAYWLGMNGRRIKVSSLTFKNGSIF